MFHLTYIINYQGGTEENHMIEGLVNLGSLEDILAAIVTDPLVSSSVFTVVRAKQQVKSTNVTHRTITKK